MNRQQSGFTLVEIAIVLVIIGLLLGGVLKGQELINSAKSKAVVTEFRNTLTMINAYQDRFRALPGDDPSANTHVNGGIVAALPAAGRGNGQIEGGWDSVDGTAESVLMWQHLRLANLLAGDTANPTGAASLDGWRPRNPEGGLIGVQSVSPVAGMQGRIFVCQNAISGRIAQQVDATIDDGNPNTGAVRFGTPGAGSAWVSASAPVPDGQLYTICEGS